MAATEEAAVGGERRGMRRSEHQMAGAVDNRALFLRMAAPQHEYQVFASFVEHGNHVVGEGFPAQRGVGMRLSGAHGEHGVEQQHALLRPALQIAVFGDLKAGDVLCQLFVNINQGWRHGHAFAHGKSQPVRLVGTMVRVLPEDDHAHLSELGGTEGVEYVGGGRVHNLPGCALVVHAMDNVLEIRLLFFRTDGFVPSLHGVSL